MSDGQDEHCKFNNPDLTLGSNHQCTYYISKGARN